MTLNAGWVYTISMQTSGNSFLSIQDATGRSCLERRRLAELPRQHAGLADRFHAGRQGDLYDHLQPRNAGTPLSYTLTIASPSPAVPTLVLITVPVSAIRHSREPRVTRGMRPAPC